MKQKNFIGKKYNGANMKKQNLILNKIRKKEKNVKELKGKKIKQKKL